MAANKLLTWTFRAGVAAALAGVGLTQFFFTVDAGERAVVLNQLAGLKKKIYGEGMHFRVPVIDSPKIFEVRTNWSSISSISGTKDLQMANIVLRILYRPNAKFLREIFLKLGQNYHERILPSISNEVLKAVIARYNADQLLTQRERVSLEIKKEMLVRAKDFNIIIDDVAITELTFGDVFTRAIEGKQIAQQNAERYPFPESLVPSTSSPRTKNSKRPTS